MKPIHYPECTTVYAEEQPEYNRLPCHKSDDESGTVVICWQLTFKERLKLLFTGKLWHYVLTFGTPLQPILLDTESPKFVSIGDGKSELL